MRKESFDSNYIDMGHITENKVKNENSDENVTDADR